MGIITNSTRKNSISLSEQEADLLLRTISSCTFEGKDVFLLSSVTKKLSDFIENK
jgi:hypothetical protein